MLLLIACVLLSGEPDALREITPGGRDVGPMSRATPVRRVDMRLTDGFRSLFETPDGQFVRVQGAVHAVFPRSVYQGGQAVVPPGTVFYIGLPPWAQSAVPPPDDTLGRRVERRLDRRVWGDAERAPRGGGGALSSSAARAAPTYAIWTAGRAQRVRTLLERALDAGG